MKSQESQKQYFSKWNIQRQEELTMLLLCRSANETSNFINKVGEIAANQGFVNEQIYRLKLAAWYYDAGYNLKAETGNYEFTDEAASYLLRMQIDPAKLTRFTSKIGMHQTEKLNYTEMIFQDAELVNLINTKYLNRNIMIRKLLSRKYGVNFTNRELLQIMYSMVSSRIFYTAYARSKYGSDKNNIQDELLVMIHQQKRAS